MILVKIILRQAGYQHQTPFTKALIRTKYFHAVGIGEKKSISFYGHQALWLLQDLVDHDNSKNNLS